MDETPPANINIIISMCRLSSFSSQDSKRLRFCNFCFMIITFIFQDIALWRFCSVPNCGLAVALPTETTPFMEILKLPVCMTSRWAKHRCSKHTKRRWTVVADCAQATSELDKHAIYVEHQPVSAGGPIVHMHAFSLFQISVTFHSWRRSYPDHKQKGAKLNFAFGLVSGSGGYLSLIACYACKCLWSHMQTGFRRVSEHLKVHDFWGHAQPFLCSCLFFVPDVTLRLCALPTHHRGTLPYQCLWQDRVIAWQHWREPVWSHATAPLTPCLSVLVMGWRTATYVWQHAQDKTWECLQRQKRRRWFLEDKETMPKLLEMYAYTRQVLQAKDRERSRTAKAEGSGSNPAWRRSFALSPFLLKYHLSTLFSVPFHFLFQSQFPFDFLIFD